MAIPKEILSVERPKNTVVRKGFGGIYYVIKRTSQRVEGKKYPIPVDLGTIGKIENGKYVEIREEPKQKYKKNISNSIDIKVLGRTKLCMDVSNDILDLLKSIYDEKTAYQLYVMSILRACEPDLKYRDIGFEYETSYISNIIKNLSLSKSTLSDLLLQVGQNYSKIHSFMKKRLEETDTSECIIDGTIKKCNCDTTNLNEYSRKAHEKTGTDISIVYMYNYKTKEPIASKVFPGNMLDKTSINDFLDEYSKNSDNLPLTIFDKGFFNSKSIMEYEKTRKIIYLCALKNNDRIITENNGYDSISKPFKNNKDKLVFYKKVKIDDNHYLYCFRDPEIEKAEEIAYTNKKLKDDKFDEEKLNNEKKKFGVLCLLSNKDMDPYEVYKAYISRWEIETMFNLYKCIIDLDTSNVQTDYRIYSSEFINYLSLIIASRIKRKMDDVEITTSKNKTKKISELYSYKQLMRYLGKVQIVRLNNKDWKMVTTVKYIDELVKALDLFV